MYIKFVNNELNLKKTMDKAKKKEENVNKKIFCIYIIFKMPSRPSIIQVLLCKHRRDCVLNLNHHSVFIIVPIVSAKTKKICLFSHKKLIVMGQLLS